MAKKRNNSNVTRSISAVPVGSLPPINPETEAYRKYIAPPTGGQGNAGDRGSESRTKDYWDNWKKEHSDGLSDYLDWRNPGGQPESRPTDQYNQDKLKWEQFEKDRFGGALEPGQGSGDRGKYTIDDLYIKSSDKRWRDKQRDLYIDPNKKGGGGKKGPTRKPDKTSGPGNPNTGGGGGGAGDANL